MPPTFVVFFSQPKIQAITLSFCFGALFLFAPLMQRRVRSRLSPKQQALYDPIAKDILRQVWFLFACVVFYSIVALIKQDASFITGDALPFVSVGAGCASLWNIRRAVEAIEKAQRGSNANRCVRLGDVYRVNLKAYTAGLISFLYGSVVVLVVLLAPDALPASTWFASFLMTGPAIYALSWSISGLAVATEYERNARLGSSNPSLQVTLRDKAPRRAPELER